MGFHIIGLVCILVILLPNVLLYCFKPTDVTELKKEPLALTIIENLGRIACIVLPLIFGKHIANQRFDFSTATMLVCAIIYYACWIRYYIGKRKFELLFKPLWIIPIPMAIFPIVYFLFIAIWIQSFLMGAAVLAFAAGHIPISWITYKQIR